MYKENDYQTIKFWHTRCLVFFYICLFLIIALLSLSLCFTSYLVYRYYEIFGGIAFALLSFLAIFLLYKSADYKRLMLHYESVMAEKKEYVDGEVMRISEEIVTLDDDIRVKEVTLIVKGEKVVYYLLSILDDGSIKTGTSYHFLIADRFIREREYEL